MKYWKKLNGECGTMDNDGFVPDSIEIRKVEYQDWVEKYTPSPESTPKSDIEKLVTYAKKQKWI